VAERAVARAGPAAAGPGGAAADELARPFLDGVRERIADGVRARLPAGHADPGGIASAYTAALAPRLARIAALTTDFECGLAAAAGDGQFSAGLSTPAGLVALFTRYPVLARLLATASMQSAEAGLELLARFAADRPAIVGDLLGGTDPGPVVAVRPGLGDPHRGGRTVMSVSFADGRAVIYKPRTLAAHEAFGRVIAWVNDRVPGACLRLPAAVPGPGYGWLEFVASEPLPQAGAATEFYWREGVLLAILYALHACDLHGENLVASGAVPVPVDLETILHPSLPAARTTMADPAAEALADSVQRAALLPYLVVGEDGVSDRSGMGGRPGSGAANRPRWDGTTIEATGYRSAILDGFRAGYDAIAAGATGFARLLESTAGLEVRTVIRPTSGYTRLLDASTHPDLMRDAVLRDEALGVLRAASAGQPPWDQLAGYELADLWNGDVPLLTSRPAAADIWTSAGQRLPGVLGQPVLSRALAKLAAMSEVDRRDQEWIIAASLATRLPYSGHRGARPAPGPLTAVAAEPGRLLAAACGLGDQIVARAAAGAREGGSGAGGEAG
jgi:lantibiotic modifying enzyme